MRKFATPILCSANSNVVASTPRPYLTLRRKLMDEASSKYLVGHDTSPMRNPKCTHCARIWLSKTKSSEFSNRGRCSTTCALKERQPEWYSESLTSRYTFSNAVRER